MISIMTGEAVSIWRHSYRSTHALRVMKRLMLTTGSAAAFGIASAAYAQDVSTGAGEVTEQVVVSSSRITASGFDAPTPTTVVSATDIANSAEPNVFVTLTQLPSLQASTGTTVANGGASGGANAISSFNLRGLGTIRTLTLLDGERVVPANVTGVPDISEFPQMLIQRVDIVTGGASASWGSDAIGGVVNFVTDKKFEGFKINVEGGITTYGDDINGDFQVVAGTSFLDGKAHIEGGVEFEHEDGVPSAGFGGAGPNGRNWYSAPGLQVGTIAGTPAGLPQITRISNAQDYQFAKYGLITSGPLQGIAFGANGQPTEFQYGSGGVPTGTGSVTNCVNPFCVGGDQSGNVGNGATLADRISRYDLYSRMSYDLTPTDEIFATVNLASVPSSYTPNPGAFKNANLTLQCSNPFVPASVQASCTADRITSFQFGTSNAEFPQNISVNNIRDQRRFVVGADGSFGLLGKAWTYDAYFQHGENNTSIHLDNITLTPRYNDAIQAITGPGGVIECASAVARAAGCVPLDVFGNVTPSAGTMAYIEPANGPISIANERQEAGSVSLNGKPFDNWAGPIAVATGVEYREEAYAVAGDPYGNGETASDPYTAQYPADPVLSTAGNNWYSGNFHNGRGNYHVWEAFLEMGVPLWANENWGKADLDLAGRATDYSTSGYVQTWKVGGTWDTPLDGIRLRALQSRDVRAPNLSELFSAPTVSNGTVINDATNTSVTILNEGLGNPKLVPEKSSTTELGLVLQEPTWLRGFSASIDWYRTEVKGVISSLSAQNIEDLCFDEHNANACSDVLLTSPTPNTNFVVSQAFNLATLLTSGEDFEASYRFDLQDWQAFPIPGSFDLRVLANHNDDFVVNPGIVGGVVTESAGSNAASTPLWKLDAVQTWNNGVWSFSLTERWFSDGVYNKNYIQCTSGCPVPTLANPTINNDVMAGAFYLDIGGSYTLDENKTFYFKVDNVTNLAPAQDPSPLPNNVNGANAALYDTLGRMYRIGVRAAF